MLQWIRDTCPERLQCVLPHNKACLSWFHLARMCWETADAFCRVPCSVIRICVSAGDLQALQFNGSVKGNDNGCIMPKHLRHTAVVIPHRAWSDTSICHKCGPWNDITTHERHRSCSRCATEVKTESWRPSGWQRQPWMRCCLTLRQAMNHLQPWAQLPHGVPWPDVTQACQSWTMCHPPLQCLAVLTLDCRSKTLLRL